MRPTCGGRGIRAKTVRSPIDAFKLLVSAVGHVWALYFYIII